MLLTPSSSLKNLNQRNERLVNWITYTLIVVVIICGILLLSNILNLDRQNADVASNGKISLDLNKIREVSLPTDADESAPRNPDCRFWDCLNLYRCGQGGHERLTVYVYPMRDYVDEKTGKPAATLTTEYYQILKTVVKSPYYTSNPNEACLFLPSIDLLNQNLIDLKLVNRVLASLVHWEGGQNHLIFNMLPNSMRILNATKDDLNTDQAIIVGATFDSWTYRIGYDVAIPVWSPHLRNFDAAKMKSHFPRRHLLISPQLNTLPEQKQFLLAIAQEHPKKIIVLQACSGKVEKTPGESVRCSVTATRERVHEYPHVLKEATFCLLTRSLHMSQPEFIEMLSHGCIPVIAVDNYVLPFEDVIDWSLASMTIRQSELHSIIAQLEAVSNVNILEMQQQVKWLYQQYFKDLPTITLTTLKILEDRIFPHRGRNLKQWNTINNNYRIAHNPLFLPLIPPKTQGFTAVILTYDRVESLFTLIQKLSIVPSLQSILVIWNNQWKSPPHLSAYPTISKPLKVIQTRANKLSNRFYPYAEIETEAILTIDDDIVMLTSDELDFGYEVWREFPDRIVGFPSRIHVWNNVTMRWSYKSEWTNEISMVLTGAAFHHKFWSHMYTYHQPHDIKDWVDENMNCEDIAMNFLVANITNKPPIKVTPRKKFKCPECTNTEMLSADANHMRIRSACIDRFAQIYGHMPLRSVEFRADPVLFKDNFPEKLKRFNDIGSL